MNKYLNPKSYVKWAFNKLLILTTPIIRLWEKKYIKKYSNQLLKHQPVFIIGAPRTGSTIIYQTITNQLDALYVDNLICRLSKNFFFGFWLSDKLFKQKSHNCFQSNHGDTSLYGWHAPSECGDFWYKWLPTYKHFIDYDDINEEMVKEIREEITAVINYFDKPIIFKNLNMGQRMRLIKMCFPKAKFIFVKREPLFTAQSILRAKRNLKLQDDEFWSIMPVNINDLKKCNSYEQVVKQIYYIEKQILIDLKLFNKNNCFTVYYNQLGDNFEDIMQKNRSFIGVNKKLQFYKAHIDLKKKLILNDSEIKTLKNEILKMDWENYNDK